MKPPTATPLTPLTLREAAARAGVSISTVRRRKSALLEAGATVAPTGWSIPLAAFESVFLTPPERAHDSPPNTPNDSPLDSALVAQLRSENEFLRQQVEQQSRTIERQAEAHAVISAQLTRFGQIEAQSVASPEPNPAENPPRHRRWWRARLHSSR